MKIDEILNLFKAHECTDLVWEGRCSDCKAHVTIQAALNPTPDGSEEISVSGGAIYKTAAGNFYKCDGCYQKDKSLRFFQECEVYSRVVGYLRPFKQWNPGKQTEFNDRKMFNLNSKPEGF
jgi:hypothetical protein